MRSIFILHVCYTEDKMSKILVINGPNLNLLGKREKNHYGVSSLEDINLTLLELAKDFNFHLDLIQSNSESELIDKIHSVLNNNIEFIIINPAAFTHTSIAIRDALLAVKLPFIEVHISNVHARERFRHHSYFSDIAVGSIVGLGMEGYLLALRYAKSHLENSQKAKIKEVELES